MNPNLLWMEVRQELYLYVARKEQPDSCSYYSGEERKREEEVEEEVQPVDLDVRRRKETRKILIGFFERMLVSQQQKDPCLEMLWLLTKQEDEEEEGDS